MKSGDRQRFFGRPAKFQALVNLAPINAERFRPFGERLGVAERLNEYAVALVSGLFRRRGPAAIRGAVVGIYFNAVNRVGASWCGSHVGKEVLKFMPALANLDAAPAVACIVWAIGVMAALHHVGPGLVFLGLLPNSGMAVSGIGFGGLLALQASARPGVTVGQLRSIDNGLRAALAQAAPVGTSATNFSKFQHRERVEGLSRKIKSLWHFVTSKCVTGMGAWRSAVNRFSGATLAKHHHFTAQGAI